MTNVVTLRKFSHSKTLANLGGIPGTHPLLQPEFFSISCSSSKNFGQIFAPPWRVGVPYYEESWIRQCKVKKNKQVERCRSSLCINLHYVQIPVIIMIINKSMIRVNNTQHGDTCMHPVRLGSSTSFSHESEFQTTLPVK